MSRTYRHYYTGSSKHCYCYRCSVDRPHQTRHERRRRNISDATEETETRVLVSFPEAILREKPKYHFLSFDWDPYDDIACDDYDRDFQELRDAYYEEYLPPLETPIEQYRRKMIIDYVETRQEYAYFPMKSPNIQKTRQSRYGHYTKWDHVRIALKKGRRFTLEHFRKIKGTEELRLSDQIHTDKRAREVPPKYVSIRKYPWWARITKMLETMSPQLLYNRLVSWWNTLDPLTQSDLKSLELRIPWRNYAATSDATAIAKRHVPFTLHNLVAYLAVDPGPIVRYLKPYCSGLGTLKMGWRLQREGITDRFMLGNDIFSIYPALNEVDEKLKSFHTYLMDYFVKWCDENPDKNHCR